MEVRLQGEGAALAGDEWNEENRPDLAEGAEADEDERPDSVPTRKRRLNLPPKEAHRKALYCMVIRQLEHDGFVSAAEVVSQATRAIAPVVSNEEGDRLSNLVRLGLQAEQMGMSATGIVSQRAIARRKIEDAIDPVSSTAGPVNNALSRYCEKYVTSHRSAVRCVEFSPDGKYVAAASADGVVRITDVAASHQHYLDATDFKRPSNEALVRTVRGHAQTVESLSFHPTMPILASAGRDTAVHFNNYTTPTVTLHCEPVQDTYAVRCGMFHPSGEHYLYGTDHPQLRLFDLSSQTLHTLPMNEEQHKACVMDVAYSADGRLIASASLDGTFKIWDGVSGRCTHTAFRPHSNVGVTSVQFSRSGNFILTAGSDNQSKLWDLRKTVTECTAFGQPQRTSHTIRARFSFQENMVLAIDAIPSHVSVYDINSMKPLSKLVHSDRAAVRTLACSPAELTIATGADDLRMRLWSSMA